MEQVFIRTKDLAEMLRISKTKANELVMSGRVKSVWLDGVRLIPVEEAQAFAEQLKAGSGLSPTAA